MLSQYQKEIENFIKNNRLEKAIKRLNDVLKDGKLKDEIIGYNGNLLALEEEKRRDTIKRDDYQIEKNKIRNAILAIKNEFTDNDIRNDTVIKESRIERLRIIVTPNSEQEKKFKKLLNINYFKNVTYCDYHQISDIDANLIDLYIFDYNKEQEELLKSLLKERENPPVLIFVRDQLRWLYQKEYQDCYATANSIFTFHSRLNEILETNKWLER